MIVWEGTSGTVEASELQLPPGTWPMSLRVQGPQGVSETLERRSMVRTGGELSSVKYVGRVSGVDLTVLND